MVATAFPKVGHRPYKEAGTGAGVTARTHSGHDGKQDSAGTQIPLPAKTARGMGSPSPPLHPETLEHR